MLFRSPCKNKFSGEKFTVVSGTSEALKARYCCKIYTGLYYNNAEL